MSPIQSIKTCFSRFANFSGRASRSEFWWFIALCGVVFAALYFLQAHTWGWNLKNGPQSSILTSSLHLVIALPVLAILRSRAQDIGLHPALVFFPAMVGYFLHEILGPIAMDLETMTGPIGSEARSASYKNPLGIMRLWLMLRADLILYSLLALLMLLPTDFIRKRAILRSPNREVPQ